MDKLTAIEHDLTKAREALTALQDELPQFHTLLTDNEQDAQRLKSERASLDAQAQARGRVQIAKEMLEQHQSDIATAQAEVDRLAATQRRELLLRKMHADADDAKMHRAGLDKALGDAGKALYKASETLLKEWNAERAARQRFATTGAELVPQFNEQSLAAARGDGALVGARALMSELAERGAPVDSATDGATGRCSCLDEYPKRELPRDELSMLIWEAFRLLAGPELKKDSNIDYWLPKKVNPAAALPVYAGSSERYSL